MPAKLTTQEFIDRARAIHGDKYGYAFSVYKSSSDKVIIHCPEHKMFYQTPNHHLKGYGCSACAGVKKHTTKSFIECARSVHGDKYDYSMVDYQHSQIKITVICNHHGSFLVKPNNHLNGHGCPGCANHGFDRTKVGFLYIFRSICGRYMKIGITNKPEQRHAQLTRVTPFSFDRIELMEGQGDQIANLEKELLAEYQPAELTETFSGSTEWRLWDRSVLIRFQK